MQGTRHESPVLTSLSDLPDGERRLPTEIALANLCNPIVCEALEAWKRLAGEKRMPARADMTPRVMRGFLKYMTLVQVLEGGDFRFRVSGDVINIQQGMPLQGITTSDIDARLPGYGSHLRRLYQRVVRRREVLAYRGLYLRAADQHTFSHESIMAPLGDDGETVDHVIVVAA